MRGNTINDRGWFAAGLRKLAAFDQVLANISPVKERCEGTNAGRGYARDCLQSFERDPMKGVDPIRIRVAASWEYDRSGKDVFGLPASSRIIQLIQAARKKRSPCQQDHRQRKLADNERVTKALMAAPPRHASRAALQGVVYIQTQGKKRRHETEGDGGDERGEKRPSEHMPVKAEKDTLTVVSGGSSGKPIGGPLCDENGAGASSHSQEQGLCDQRPQQLHARCAHRGSDGKFPGARHRPGQQEVRQIGASDQQHETRQADEHRQGHENSFGKGRAVEGDRLPGAPGVYFGKVSSEARAEVGDKGSPFRLRELVGAASDRTHGDAAAVGGHFLVKCEWTKEIVRTEVTPVIEPRGQNADDLVRFAIDADNATNDIVFAAEALLPAALADNNHAIVSGNIFSRKESAAELRLNAEHRQKI